MVDGRPLPVDGLVLRPATDQSVQVSGLELVGVSGQGSQVGHAVTTGTGGEYVVEGQRRQDGKAPGTPALDGQAPAVDPTGGNQMTGHGHAVVHVE